MRGKKKESFSKQFKIFVSMKTKILIVELLSRITLKEMFLKYQLINTVQDQR